MGTLVSALPFSTNSSLLALVCMAATLGGTMRAPLTAVVFAFELTHCQDAFVPTLLASGCAYAFTVVVMPRSILTEKIAQRGFHILREYGIDPLERTLVSEVMTRNPVVVPAEMTIAAVQAKFVGEGQQHRAYPVMSGQKVLGMVERSTLGSPSDHPLGSRFQQKMVSDESAKPTQTCRKVGAFMAAHHIERLPVLENGLLVGIVSRSDVLAATRNLHHEEEIREKSW